jgi:hypothetical protein
MKEAYDDAKESFSLFDRPPFAVLSQLIKTEIETNRLPEAAEHLAKMDATFGPQYHDFKIGLRSKYEIANERFEEALGLLSRLREKDRPGHAALRLKALQGKFAREGDKSGELTAQLQKLRSKLADFDMHSLDSELGSLSISRD